MIGSTQLVKTLLDHDLVDGFHLIDPLVPGGGKRFLADDGRKRLMRLVDSSMTSTGAIFATCQVTRT